MKKLDSLVPDIEKMSISLESLKKIIRRKGLAEEQSEKDGVNGFYQYKDAIDKVYLAHYKQAVLSCAHLSYSQPLASCKGLLPLLNTAILQQSICT